MKVSELAGRLGVRFEGEGDREIVSAAPLESAGDLDLSFVGNRKAHEMASRSGAGCLVVTQDYDPGRTLLRASDPRAVFAAAVRLLYPPDPVRGGIHPTATVAATAKVHPTSEIGPSVVIGDGAVIGERCRVGSGSFVGAHVRIGFDSLLHANVTIYEGVTVGARAILHSGCVLGADGFGFVLTDGSWQKFPQIGTVVLEDDVEIGANSCVDRAALGVTHIGVGTKLDNMVHIGHNCQIGRHVVIAAQTGLSGGVVVGDYAVIGGQVGIGDKARIESRAVLGSGCGVLTSKIVRSGQPVWGTPARPLREHLESLAQIGRLPKLREEVEELRRRLAELEARL